MLEISFSQLQIWLVRGFWASLSVVWAAQGIFFALIPYSFENISNWFTEFVYPKNFSALQVESSGLTHNCVINDTCAICLEEFTQQLHVTRLQCGHGYHKQCISKWAVDKNISKCPICGEEMKPKTVHVGGRTAEFSQPHFIQYRIWLKTDVPLLRIFNSIYSVYNSGTFKDISIRSECRQIWASI